MVINRTYFVPPNGGGGSSETIKDLLELMKKLQANSGDTDQFIKMNDLEEKPEEQGDQSNEPDGPGDEGWESGDNEIQEGENSSYNSNRRQRWRYE